MTDSNWSLSSSSEDDEDAHYFQSNIREGSEYYEKYLRGDYGTDDWSDHIPQFMNLELNNTNKNRSSFGNISMLNGTMPPILHLPCSVPDRILVLNRDTSQYEIMRYVEMANGAIIKSDLEANSGSHFSDSTMNATTASTSSSLHPINNSLNLLASDPRKAPQVNRGTKPIPKCDVHIMKIIPLEPIDLIGLIDTPIDRRKKRPEPEDLMELLLPTFFDEFEWNGKKWVPATKPKPEKSHGFKPSMSYVRERRDRVNHHQQQHDPRLQKDLFSSPKRVEVQTSKNNKDNSSKDNFKDIFGCGSDSSTAFSRSRSPSMSPEFQPFNSGLGFAAERNSTVLPGNCSNSDSTASDIDISESDIFEEKPKRKLRSQSRSRKKRMDKSRDRENEKVPPLVIKLPKTLNSTDHGHSSKKQSKTKANTSTFVPSKLLKAPKELLEFKNDVLAAMQGEFFGDEDSTNKKDEEITNQFEESVSTQFIESINETNNRAANVTDSVKMNVSNHAVAGNSASDNAQPKENETKTKDVSHELEDISDAEMMDVEPGMVSHGTLTDLEDVSDETPSNNLDGISLDDKLLDEAVKKYLGENDNVEHQPNANGSSEILQDIEKSLALFDNENEESEIEKFVQADANVENVTSPNPKDRHELIKILDPNASDEQNDDAIGPSESGTENMQTETEADNYDVPEVGATTDVRTTNDIPPDQVNFDEFIDVNSFGRPRNLLPDWPNETHRLKITIQLCDYKIAETEQEKLFREHVVNKESEDSNRVDEPTVEKCEKIERQLETTSSKDENNEIPGDFSSIETSDDDQEYDHPIASENYVMPNSNTDRRVTRTNLRCTLCPYKDLVGWRKMTKHYIRKHPDTEIAHSRLAERFKFDEVIANPVSSMVTDGMLIKSICLFCDQCYCLDSSKWEKHFVSHTGECPFKCRKCGLKLFDDLHKRCNSQNNIIINGPHEFKENKLYGYVCKLCNFVQLDKKNILNHIDNQHQALRNEESIIEILLINVTEIVSQNSSTSSDIPLVEVDTDDEDDKPLKKRLPTSEKSPSNRSMNLIDLTLSDSDVE